MRYHLELAGVIALLIVTFAAGEAMAQPRVCVRADIAESFVLPDGSTHPPGLLRICLDRAYSPVAGLHSISAGDGARGIFFSRRIKAEGAMASAQFAFMRDGAGALVLRGYTVPGDGQLEAYWLQRPRGRRGAAPGTLVVEATPAETVWLAAAVIP